MADEKLKVKLHEEDPLKVRLSGITGTVMLENIHVDTTAHWNAQSSLIGRLGHLYVYSDFTEVDGEYIPAVKAGDGNAYLIDTPFITVDLSGIEGELADHIADTNVHIQPGERDKWNDKVTCFISQADATNLVFSKD